MIEIEDAIQAFSSQRIDFDSIPNKLSQKRDLHAFMLLDKLLPDGPVIIGCATHDTIYMQIELEQLCKVATIDDIIELAKCGLNYSRSEESLYMYA